MRFSILAIILPFGSQLAAAKLALWDVPELPGVHHDDVGELMSMTEFTNIDATKWADFLGQPSEQLASWDGTTKQRMFSLLHSVFNERSGLGQRADTTRAIAHSDIQQMVRKYDTEVRADQASDLVQCFSHVACPICIAAAASLAIGKFAECGSAAYAAIEAASALPGGQIAYTPIALTFISCVSIPLGGFLTAAGVCIKTLG